MPPSKNNEPVRKKQVVSAATNPFAKKRVNDRLLVFLRNVDSSELHSDFSLFNTEVNSQSELLEPSVFACVKYKTKRDELLDVIRSNIKIMKMATCESNDKATMCRNIVNRWESLNCTGTLLSCQIRLAALQLLRRYPFDLDVLLHHALTCVIKWNTMTRVNAELCLAYHQTHKIPELDYKTI